MRQILVVVLVVLSLFACGKKTSSQSGENKEAKYTFDLQGHRGARGLAPENTIAAFQKALALGVNTIELDVVVSKDRQVVVSHEPWFNPVLTLTPEGDGMEEEKVPSTNFYQMNYAQIAKYDCGSRKHPNFPHQENEAAIKPLLKDLLQIMEQASKEKGVSLHYNIEIKSMPEGDNLFHPEPKNYVEIVVATVKEQLPMNNFNIQSFDFRILKVLHTDYPEIILAALADKGELTDNLDQLGFVPQIYSPNFSMVDSTLVVEAHRRDMKVITWTVNEIKDMEHLLQIGVDGLITDYPDRALKLRK